MYGLRADAIVGYTYQAANYCTGCIEGALCDNTYSTDHDTESALTLLARDRDIDRMDEHSFDSDEFPKVIFAVQVDSPEECADCGRDLIDGLN